MTLYTRPRPTVGRGFATSSSENPGSEFGLVDTFAKFRMLGIGQGLYLGYFDCQWLWPNREPNALTPVTD